MKIITKEDTSHTPLVACSSKNLGRKLVQVCPTTTSKWPLRLYPTGIPVTHANNQWRLSVAAQIQASNEQLSVRLMPRLRGVFYPAASFIIAIYVPNLVVSCFPTSLPSGLDRKNFRSKINKKKNGLTTVRQNRTTILVNSIEQTSSIECSTPSETRWDSFQTSNGNSGYGVRIYRILLEPMLKTRKMNHHTSISTVWSWSIIKKTQEDIQLC